jgi:hypothetical protein
VNFVELHHVVQHEIPAGGGGGGARDLGGVFAGAQLLEVLVGEKVEFDGLVGAVDGEDQHLYEDRVLLEVASLLGVLLDFFSAVAAQPYFACVFVLEVDGETRAVY